MTTKLHSSRVHARKLLSDLQTILALESWFAGVIIRDGLTNGESRQSSRAALLRGESVEYGIGAFWWQFAGTFVRNLDGRNNRLVCCRSTGKLRGRSQDWRTRGSEEAGEVCRLESVGWV